MPNGWAEEKSRLGGTLLRCLYEEGMLRTWLRDQPEGWELFSGRWSPFYFMMRDAPSRPKVFKVVVEAATALIKERTPSASRIIGLAATGIPIAAAVAYEMGMPMGFNRKLPGVRNLRELEQELSRYGGHRLVEGDLAPNDRIVLLDDVVSHFDSKEIAIRQLELELTKRRVENVQVEAVAVLVDRGNEAVRRAEACGTRLERLIVLQEDCSQMLRGVASDREIQVIEDYLRHPDKYQDATVQAALAQEARAALSTAVSN